MRKEYKEVRTLIRTRVITYSQHILDKIIRENLELEKIEETIKECIINYKKSKFPNKICIKKYFGKENQTYSIILIKKKEHIEVITTWKSKGK